MYNFFFSKQAGIWEERTKCYSYNNNFNS